MLIQNTVITPGPAVELIARNGHWWSLSQIGIAFA